MGEPYRPVHRWEMDWNGDGRYDHRLSDITADVAEWQVRWGSAADTPSAAQVTRDSPDVTVVGGIGADTAVGSLAVVDRDGSLDPDNPALKVDEDKLRAPVNCRLSHDRDTVWEGRAIPVYGTAFRNTENFRWRLTGRHGERLVERISYRRSPGNLNRITDDPVPVQFTTDLPLGLVSYDGARVKFYEQLARLGGGWMVENERGDFRLVSMADANNLPPALMLSTEFERYEDTAHLAEAPPLVRTRATLAAQGWVPQVSETTGEPQEVLISSEEYVVPVPGTRFATFRMPADDPRRLDQWGVPTVSEGAAVSVASADVRGRSMRIRITQRGGGEPVVRVNFVGRISRVEEISKRDVVLFTSESVYGKRDLGLPPWLSPSLAGGEKVIVPWLDTLSSPLQYFRVTYPEWQADRNRLTQLREAKPGQVVNVELPSKQRSERILKAIILACRIQGGFRQIPTRTLYGVETRIGSVPSLTSMVSEATGPESIQVQLRTSFVNEAVYVNVEKA